MTVGLEIVVTALALLVAVHDRALAPFFRDVGFREEPLACLGTSV